MTESQGEPQADGTPLNSSDSSAGSSAGSQKSKRWPWLVGATVGLLVVLGVIGAVVGSPKKPSNDHAKVADERTTVRTAAAPTTTSIPPTTTVPLTAVTWLSQYGGIFATLLNDVAAINSPVQPTGNETGQSLLLGACKQLQSDVLQAAGLPQNPNAAAVSAFQMMLDQHITGVDSTDVGNSAPVDAGTLSAAAHACASDPDPLDTYGHKASNDHIFVVVANGPPLIRAAQAAAQAAAPGTSIAAPTTTTTTGAPTVVLKVSGSGPATSITIDLDGNETQQNDESLPWMDFPGTVPGVTVLGAQSSNGSSSASVTCEIDYPGQTPVTETSTGPYADVECTAKSG